jgi:hypothetical protein
MVIANFHGSETLRGVRVRIPADAHRFLGRDDEEKWKFSDRLEGVWEGEAEKELLDTPGVMMPDLPPSSALLLEIGS